MNINLPSIRRYRVWLGSICGGLVMGLATIPLAVLAQSSLAKVNPCPRIFYEEPHNNQVLVPAGCPPNQMTLKMMEQGLIPVTPIVPGTPSAEQIRLGVGGEKPSVLNPHPSIFDEPPYNLSQRGLPPNAFSPPIILVPIPREQSFSPNSPISIAPPSLSPPQSETAPVTKIALANGKVNIKLVNKTGANLRYQVVEGMSERSLAGKSNIRLRNLNVPITLTFQREDRGMLTVTPRSTSQSGELEVTFQETSNANQNRKALRIEPDGNVFLN
jgi:hypothetical protein